MTREEAIERLKQIPDETPVGEVRTRADHVLCALLDALGYEDVVAAYVAALEDPRHEDTNRRRNRLVEMYTSGMKVKDIAREMRMSVSGVHRALVAMGVFKSTRTGTAHAPPEG